MKEIFLKNDGSINVEKINEYIQSEGIDTTYDDPTSPYYKRTLLYGAIHDSGINPHTKLQLVAYLIDKGANVNDFWNREGIAIALSQANLDLAKLLLKAGADIS